MARHFSKEDIKIANRYMKKKMLKIASPRRNANKTSKRHHLTSVKMASLKGLQITNVGEDVKKRGKQYIFVGILNW